MIELAEPVGSASVVDDATHGSVLKERPGNILAGTLPKCAGLGRPAVVLEVGIEQIPQVIRVVRERDAVGGRRADPAAGHAILLPDLEPYHVIVYGDVLQIDGSTVGSGIALRCAVDPIRIESDTVLTRR